MFTQKEREKIKKAMKHPDKTGAGARKRESLNKKLNAAAISKEFKRGTLHSGSGAIVKSEAQKRAIIANTNKGRKG
jgi:hypothetical protein